MATISALSLRQLSWSVFVVAVASGLQLWVPVVDDLTPAHGLLGTGLVVAQGAALMWRTRYPLRTLTVVTAIFCLACVVAPITLPACGFIALVDTIALAPRIWTALSSAALAVAAAGAAVVLNHSGPIYQLASLPIPTVAAVGTGGVIRLQRSRSELLARERVSTVQQEWTRQRLALARDLHDLVGHGLSTIAVQSSTARLALQAGRVDTALAAVTAVEKGSRDTMAGVRELLELLHEDDGEPAEPSQSRRPPPGLADVTALVAQLPDVVSVDLDLQPGLSPTPVVGLCAFRVVQEALTNVVRHAPGAAVRVRVHSQDGVLVVEVTDDGAGAGSGPGGAGFGLRGMRERLNALGGTLTAGPGAHGGWQVRAEMPMGKELS